MGVLCRLNKMLSSSSGVAGGEGEGGGGGGGDLVNPGFETGDLTGWAENPDLVVVESQGTIAAPHGGSFFLSTTFGAEFLTMDADDEIDLEAIGFNTAEIDAGTATYEFSMWWASTIDVSGANAPDITLFFNSVRGGAGDVDFAQLLNFALTNYAAAGWQQATLPGTVPAGSRFVAIRLGLRGTQGADDLSFVQT